MFNPVVPQLAGLGERRIGQRQPVRRQHQGQLKARLQVGLVEQGKRGSCAVGNEKGVEKVRVAVEGIVSRDKVDSDAVAPLAQRGRGQDYVLIAQIEFDSFAVYLQRKDTGFVLAKVKLQRRPGIFEVETDRGGCRYGDMYIRRDIKVQTVFEVRQQSRPAPGKVLGKARLGHYRLLLHHLAHLCLFTARCHCQPRHYQHQPPWKKNHPCPPGPTHRAPV